jgi:hypothetical protein
MWSEHLRIEKWFLEQILGFIPILTEFHCSKGAGTVDSAAWRDCSTVTPCATIIAFDHQQQQIQASRTVPSKSVCTYLCDRTLLSLYVHIAYYNLHCSARLCVRIWDKCDDDCLWELDAQHHVDLMVVVPLLLLCCFRCCAWRVAGCVSYIVENDFQHVKQTCHQHRTNVTDSQLTAHRFDFSQHIVFLWLTHC